MSKIFQLLHLSFGAHLPGVNLSNVWFSSLYLCWVHIYRHSILNFPLIFLSQLIYETVFTSASFYFSHTFLFHIFFFQKFLSSPFYVQDPRNGKRKTTVFCIGIYRWLHVKHCLTTKASVVIYLLPYQFSKDVQQRQ